MIAAMGRQAGPAARTPLPGGLQHFRPTVIRETDALALQMSGSQHSAENSGRPSEERDDRCTNCFPRCGCTAGGTRAADNYAGTDQRGDRDEHSGAGRNPTTGGVRDAKGGGMTDPLSPPIIGGRRKRSDSGDIPSPRSRWRSRQ